MKYWRIGKRKINVSEEVYEVLRSSYRQEKYLKEDDMAHGVISLDALKREPHSPLSDESEIEKAEMLKKLSKALSMLSDEEFDFINLHFFGGVSLGEIAELKKVKYKTLWNYRRMLLKKLRKIIINIE